MRVARSPPPRLPNKGDFVVPVFAGMALLRFALDCAGRAWVRHSPCPPLHLIFVFLAKVGAPGRRGASESGPQPEIKYELKPADPFSLYGRRLG